MADASVVPVVGRRPAFSGACEPENDSDIAIAAIAESELLVGVELADEQRRAARQATVDALLATFDVDMLDIGRFA